MDTESMLVTILQKITSIDEKVDSLSTRMDSMENRMSSVESRVDSLETRIKPLEVLPRQVKELQLTLENEVCRNTRIIAEGHIDLSRKLDEAMAFEREREMFLIRVTALECDVRKIKDRIGIAI